MGRSLSRAIGRCYVFPGGSEDWAVADGGRGPAEPCIRSARVEPNPHPASSAVIGPGGRDPSFGRWVNPKGHRSHVRPGASGSVAAAPDLAHARIEAPSGTTPLAR